MAESEEVQSASKGFCLEPFGDARLTLDTRSLRKEQGCWKAAGFTTVIKMVRTMGASDICRLFMARQALYSALCVDGLK